MQQNEQTGIYKEPKEYSQSTHLQHTGVNTTNNNKEIQRWPLESQDNNEITQETEGASIENDDRNLETIHEEERFIPEVTGDITEREDPPDDHAIIASFTPTQEAFLERLLK